MFHWMKKRKKKENWQKELLMILNECQDRCFETDMENICRDIGRNIKENGLADDFVYDMWENLEAARLELRQKHFNTANVYLGRTLFLCKESRTGKAVDRHMGLINYIKGKIEKRESDSRAKILDLEGKETEQRIFDIEKKIAMLYDSNSELMKQFESKVKKCLTLGKDDNVYSQTRQQALAMLPRIKSIEKQINMYAKMLEGSSRYQAMIEMGKTTIDIQKYMPDVNRVEAMMEWISEETQEVSENMESLSSEMNRFEKEISSATSGEAFAEDDFDQYVSNMQNAKKAKEEKISADQSVKVDVLSNMELVDRKQDIQELLV